MVKTELHTAAWKGDLKRVMALAGNDIDVVDEKDDSGYTALHVAAFNNNNIEIVRYLVEECHAHVDATDKLGHTPLHFAAKCGRLDVLKYLVEEANADLWIKDQNGQTACDVTDIFAQEKRKYLKKMMADGVGGSIMTKSAAK